MDNEFGITNELKAVIDTIIGLGVHLSKYYGWGERPIMMIEGYKVEFNFTPNYIGYIINDTISFDIY